MSGRSGRGVLAGIVFAAGVVMAVPAVGFAIAWPLWWLATNLRGVYSGIAVVALAVRHVRARTAPDL